MKSQWLSLDQLRAIQNEKLRFMAKYAYKYVPYYTKLFNRLGIVPEDIKTVDDLVALPIIDKELIKNNWDDFKLRNLEKVKYEIRSTGGTTGTPFSYRLSKNDRFLSAALMYRGWSYGGYDLGDKMVFMGGASLSVDTKNNLIKTLHEKARNLKKLSSFDMSENELENHYNIIREWRPKFIRGYPSSIYYFSKWLEETGREPFKLQACFTTSEQLFDEMRPVISRSFGCKVFDNYGLNDGGVSVFECSEGSLHIDMERGVLEVVDDNGNPQATGVGKIVATSLSNWAMPFFRYDTGDLAEKTGNVCSCGRGLPILKSLKGRTTDILITPEGKRIHGWFFLYIFWKYGETITEYQVVQSNREEVVIKIVPGRGFNENVLKAIEDTIRERCTSWKILFNITDKIEKTASGKMHFIINNIGK